MSKKIGIITLGCRVNQYESNAIAEELVRHGYFVSSRCEDADFAIVNTCAVTAESERKSRQTVRRVAKNCKTLVLGCAAQLGGFDDIANVIHVCGCRDKLSAAKRIIEYDGDTELTDLRTTMDGAEYEKMSITDMSILFSDCRAFVKIQDGCNGKCAYCIIPKCRGKVRSRPFSEVLSEVRGLVSKGYKEVILTGIETAAYNGAPLWEVVRSMSEIEGLHRVRLGSLTPNAINPTFAEAAADSKKFMPHLHLSLQSCCDATLRRMNRPYTKKDIFERVELVRKKIPCINLSADIIVGFPGETESDFYETLDALKQLRISHVHSFPYSERKGTVAAELKNSVPVGERHKRNGILIRETEKNFKTIFSELLGKERTLLIEKIDKKGYAVGHTEDFFEARVKNKGYLPGDLVLVDIISCCGTVLETEAKKISEELQ